MTVWPFGVGAADTGFGVGLGEGRDVGALVVGLTDGRVDGWKVGC